MQPKRQQQHLTFTWREVTARVTLTHNYRIEGWTMLDIRITSPPGATPPFAIDGHRHHGLEQAELDAAGGVQSFLTAWADRDAAIPAYAMAVARWRQGDLFRTLRRVLPIHSTSPLGSSRETRFNRRGFRVRGCCRPQTDHNPPRKP